MTELEQIDNIIKAFDDGREALTKFAFTPTAPPAPPMTAQPPMDPNAGGAPMPPVDPNMAPPPGDPNAMPPQDPNAAPPPPPADGGAPQGGISPELEGAISQLAGGMSSVTQTVEEQQAQTDQLSQRMLAMEEELNKMKTNLEGPAPFEGDAGAATPENTPQPSAQ